MTDLNCPLDAVPRYTQLGLVVHPCCPVNHICHSPGKVPYNLFTGQHLQEWTKHPQVTPTQWEAWKEEHEYKDCNVGCLCGSPSGIIAVDIDSMEGREYLEQVILENSIKRLRTWQYTTGKGWRILYRYTGKFGSLKVGTQVSNFEVLGDGAQTVLPPSNHPNGNVYTWRDGYAPKDIPLDVAPDWLVGLCPTSTQNIPDEWEEVHEEDVPKGNRNSFLTKLAGHLLAPRPLPASEVFLWLKLFNEKRCSPPLSDREIKQIVVSISKRERAGKMTDSEQQAVLQKLGLKDVELRKR